MSKSAYARGTIQHKCPLTGEWVDLVTVGTPVDAIQPYKPEKAGSLAKAFITIDLRTRVQQAYRAGGRDD